MTKNELRKSIIAARQALTDQQVTEKSNIIVKQLLALEQYQNALTVMLYIDFRHEVQTNAIIKDAMSQGKKIVIPITDVKQKKLTPSWLKHFPDDLMLGTWGILEPKPECVRPVDPKEIDLVVVPGVAFDVLGNRLGYGGGFYDRFLIRTRPDTVFVAIAFELQVKNQLNPHSYDVPMHYLITEQKIRHFT